MSTTNYPGIDYSHGQSNRDADTGIRYGVISQNSVSGEAVEDVYHGPHSKCLAFEAAGKELKRNLRMALEDYYHGSRLDEAVDDIFDELNGWSEDIETDPLYEHDGYKIVKCLNNDLFVLKSPFYTYAQYCSPCVPGAGNLDHPFDGPIENWCTAAEESGFPKVFCLGHDWFEDSIAPYHVFSVATNEQVHP